MTTCPPCAAAKELVKARDQILTAAKANRIQRVDFDRHKTAETAWDTARNKPHTCRTARSAA